MRLILKNKIIIHVVLFCIFLNISLCQITLNGRLDLSVMFSCAAGTVTYSYNPIELTKGLQDNVLGYLYKNSDKKNNTKNEKNNAADDKSKDCAIAVSYCYKIQTFKQFNNPAYEKFYTKDRWLTNNPQADFLSSDFMLPVFCFMLLGWLAVIFRKRRDFIKKYKYCMKPYNF